MQLDPRKGLFYEGFPVEDMGSVLEHADAVHELGAEIGDQLTWLVVMKKWELQTREVGRVP
ncbi:hypothetical protein BC2230_120201 [Burkholderia cepacia]